MTYTTFSRLIAEAQDQPDLDLYIAERGYQMNWMPQYTADQIIGILTDIHTCTRAGDFHSIVNVSGLSRRALSIRLGIPVRSADNWCAAGDNHRDAPAYVLHLILYAVISDKYPAVVPDAEQ